jgi:hypothetical protein
MGMLYTLEDVADAVDDAEPFILDVVVMDVSARD